MCKEHLPIVEKLDEMTNKHFVQQEADARAAGFEALGQYLVHTYGHANLAKLGELEAALAMKKYDDARMDKLDELLDGEAPF